MHWHHTKLFIVQQITDPTAQQADRRIFVQALQTCQEKKAPPIKRWRKYLQLNYKPLNKYLIFEISIFCHDGKIQYVQQMPDS